MNTSHIYPGIRQGSTAIVLNDMINANLRTDNSEHNQAIERSNIVQSTAKLVERGRELNLPVFWIRVERRADQKDVFGPLTDNLVVNDWKTKAPITRGDQRAENISELPVMDQDHVILKPRFDPFIGTDLDLRLRTNFVDTILLGGYSTNIGVESCARTAHDLNYNVILLRDCCFNVNESLHEWTIEHIMPRFARVMDSDEALGCIK